MLIPDSLIRQAIGFDFFQFSPNAALPAVLICEA